MQETDPPLQQGASDGEGFFEGLPSGVMEIGKDVYAAGATFWEESLKLPPARYLDFVYTVLIFTVYLVLRTYVVAPVSRRFKLPARRYSVRKVGNGTLAGIAFVITAVVWIDTGGTELLTFFGFIGAGLAVAMQDIILNFFGWLFILVREPFSVRDRVAIADDVKGDVIDVRLFMFSLLEVGGWVDAEQSTGRIVHVPNSVVFRKSIANYTQGFQYIWNEIPVLVTFESDWEKAHKLLTQIIQEQSKEVAAEAEKEIHKTSTRFMVYYTRFTPIVWVNTKESGVLLTIRYLCNARRRRSSEHVIWADILRAFAKEPSIDFAYPTTRFYANHREGKPEAGGPPIATKRPEAQRPQVTPRGEQRIEEAETGDFPLPGVTDAIPQQDEDAASAAD